MAEDFRVKTSWRSSGKRRRLKRIAGLEGVQAIEDLWSYCASERPDGDLSGLTDDEIADECPDWDRSGAELVAALREARLIDGEPGRYRIHDWQDHQPYVTGEAERKGTGTYAAHCRWHTGPEGKPSDACDYCKDASNATHASHDASNASHAKRNAPTYLPTYLPERDDRARGNLESGGEVEEGGDEVLTPAEIEAIGYPRYGALAGKGLIAMRKLGDVRRHELDDAMRTEGKSWAYCAKVIASMREEAAKPRAPPGAPRSRAGPGGQRSAFRDATERALAWAQEEDAKDAADRFSPPHDPPAGLLPAEGGRR